MDDRLPEDPLFETAVAVVLAHEGGVADDPDDPGGATNFGISLRLAQQLGDLDGDGQLDLDLDHDGDVDAADIKRLTRAEAKRVYRCCFWDRYGYARLGLSLGAKVFDLAVNMGPRQAHLCLQRALRACGQRVDEDGVLGPQTCAAVMSVGAVPLLAALRAEAAGFYRALVVRRPRSAKYLAGWLNRAYA